MKKLPCWLLCRCSVLKFMLKPSNGITVMSQKIMLVACSPNHLMVSIMKLQNSYLMNSPMHASCCVTYSKWWGIYRAGQSSTVNVYYSTTKLKYNGEGYSVPQELFFGCFCITTFGLHAMMQKIKYLWLWFVLTCSSLLFIPSFHHETLKNCFPSKMVTNCFDYTVHL